MAKVILMTENLANKIAAGEVVEKCSSVVKELVENSIDAGSTEIKIDLIESGTKLIRIIDNGIGMEREDAKLAFARHATSKLKSEEDLFHLTSLGFRGEALPSIAAVSDITLITSTGSVGTHLELTGGKLTFEESSDARKGTIIEVKNLFYNTPARLKYLKSLYSELANITDYVNKIALSHPEIKFILTNDEKVLLNTSGDNNLLKVIKNIYGIEVAKKMILVSGTNYDYEINGFISLPEVTRSTRTYITTLVNGRVVRNQELNKSINDAYHTYKFENRYPIVILNITTDPSTIDVNVHPSKLDIKFSNFEELKELINNVIKSSLKEAMLIPKITVQEKIERPKYEETVLDFDQVVNEPVIKYDNSLLINDTKQQDIILEELKKELPELYPVGIVHGTYIICENKDAMYLIDQHAAKERCNYEKYLESLGNPKQNITDMLVPIYIELPNNETLIIKQNYDVFTRIGIDISEFGINTFIIKAHPTWLPSGYEEISLRKIIDLVLQKEKKFNVLEFNEKVAITLSCKMAIKANQYISMEEAKILLEDLRRCNNPYNCPHGRPTIISFTNYEIEKMFKRVV